MRYEYAADIMVLFHFLWVLFLIFGAFWGRRNRFVRYVHITGLIFAFFIETCNWFCPLTDIEVWLRSRQSPVTPYRGSFLAHYLEKLLYIEVSRSVIVVATCALCLVNICLYRKRRSS